MGNTLLGCVERGELGGGEVERWKVSGRGGAEVQASMLTKLYLTVWIGFDGN